MVIGKSIAERLMTIGCLDLVHYGHCVTGRVSASLSTDIRKLSNDSICEIAHVVPSAKCKSDVLLY